MSTTFWKSAPANAAHIIGTDGRTLCGREVAGGARFAMSDLTSGERNIRHCKSCTAAARKVAPVEAPVVEVEVEAPVVEAAPVVTVDDVLDALHGNPWDTYPMCPNDGTRVEREGHLCYACLSDAHEVDALNRAALRDQAAPVVRVDFEVLEGTQRSTSQRMSRAEADARLSRFSETRARDGWGPEGEWIGSEPRTVRGVLVLASRTYRKHGQTRTARIVAV